MAIVPARIPLDVDLEDRLLYGLTPTRLVYLVIALLAAFSTWSTDWAPSLIRVACALALAALGAASAWGRWRGRPVDAWFVDVAAYCVANYGVRIRLPAWTHRVMRRR